MTSMLYPFNFKHILTLPSRLNKHLPELNLTKKKGLRKRLTIRVRVNLKKETI